MSNIKDIEIESSTGAAESYKPSVDLNLLMTPEQRAKKHAIAARAKRWVLKREQARERSGEKIEPDMRSAQQMALDLIEENCDKNGWSFSFDEESHRMLLRNGSDLAIQAQMVYGDASVEECLFMRNCGSLESLVASMEQGIDFIRPKVETTPGPLDENQIEDQYEQVIENGMLNLWAIQGDLKDPDKLQMAKGEIMITVRWNEEGILRSSIGRRISNLVTVIDLVNQYTNNDNKE